MHLTVNIPDEEIPALRAKASGVPLEAFVEQVVLERIHSEGNQTSDPPANPLGTAAEIVLRRMRKVPPEIMATLPKDGASQHDHYIYGLPKREE